MARLWAAGEIKMPEAKRFILNCHALAKESENPEAIALCHAVGQACSVVHTGGHAMGFPIYELTALVYRFGTGHCREIIERRRQEYLEKLLFWTRKAPSIPGPWASFLQE